MGVVGPNHGELVAPRRDGGQCLVKAIVVNEPVECGNAGKSVDETGDQHQASQSPFQPPVREVAKHGRGTEAAGDDGVGLAWMSDGRVEGLRPG